MIEHIQEIRDRNVDHQNELAGPFTDIFELWRNPPEEEDTVIIPGVAERVTERTLPNVLNDLLYSEIRSSDMTNLGNMLLGYPNDSDPMHDDTRLGRLSLAHENLTYMPKIICDDFGQSVKILDICDNNIKNLDFLEHFTELTTLVADRNPINVTDTNVPWMPKLELLYLNQCKIDELYWVETLRYNCPNLRYLSMMGNPVAPSCLNGGNIFEYLQYRMYVISTIPTLIHLDDKYITVEERIQAKKMFPTPFVLNLFKTTKARLPIYIRRLTDRINHFSILSHNPNFFNKPDRNFII